MLKKIIQTQDCHEDILKQILDKVMCNELTVKQTDKKFESCAKAFYQVREACTCLSEQLDSSAGTITDSTWND